MADHNSLEVRMAIAEKDISNLGHLLTKIDDSLDKVTDIAASLKQIVLTQEMKFATQEKFNTSIETDLAALDTSMEEKIKEQTKNITKINYAKYFAMGIIILILAKLNITLPFAL
jgi:hypothetical protein